MTKSLENHTVVELKKLAKTKGLKGYSKLTKSNLISLIRKGVSECKNVSRSKNGSGGKSCKVTDKCKNKTCTSESICNPSSGRCVKKTGEIGKKLVIVIPPIKIPKLVDNKVEWVIFTILNCDLCKQAKKFLDYYNIEYYTREIFNIDKFQGSMNHIIGNYKYFPVILQNKKFIGGYEELVKIINQPIVNKTRSDNEALSLEKIHNHINNGTPCGSKIRNAFSTAFPNIPQFTRSVISGGNRTVHHDFKIEWVGTKGLLRTVEFKGSKHKKPIDATKPPWVNGVQFYNGTGSKFIVGKEYARQFYDTMMDKIIRHFDITTAKPTFEEWSKDVFIQGKPKTTFVKELRQKGYRSTYLSDIRKKFTKLFTLTSEQLETLKNEVYAISSKVLESKDYWLQIHGLIDNPSDFEVRWTGKQKMAKIVSVKKDQTKSDVDFIFTCEDGSVFNAKLRWGYGQCITNIRLDIK